MPINSDNYIGDNAVDIVNQVTGQISTEPVTSNSSTDINSAPNNNDVTIIGNNVNAMTDTQSTDATPVTREPNNNADNTTLPNKESVTESDLRAQLSLAESKLRAASVILSERERQLEARSEEQASELFIDQLHLASTDGLSTRAVCSKRTSCCARHSRNSAAQRG